MLVFNYGGGRQTVAMCLLIGKGVLPKPDVIVMADTGRENSSTWQYIQKYTQPFLAELGLTIEVAGHELATVDMYSGNGDLLLPVYTQTGKMRGFCSNEWKKRVCERYLRAKGITSGERWLGLAHNERQRWVDLHNKTEGKWKTVCPLVDLMLNTDACLTIIENHGWPLPVISSCWMCPNKKNEEWAYIRDNQPEDWAKACAVDAEVRENDEQGGVFLHHSRVPLSEADLSVKESGETIRQCSLGMCFV